MRYLANIAINKHSLATGLFYLVLFLSPFQKIVYFSQYKLDNVKYFIEYLNFYITIPEIIIIALFSIEILFHVEQYDFFKEMTLFLKKYYLIFLTVFSFSITNIFFSDAPLLSVHKFFHIYLWAIFILYAIFKIYKWQRFIEVIHIILLSSIVQSLVAIIQFNLQRSIGLKYLGESFLLPTASGVAKIDALGMKFIRAYGTFPHPNILAGFCFVVLSILFFYLINLDRISFFVSKYLVNINCSTWNNLDHFKKIKAIYREKTVGMEKILISIGIILNVIALSLTFSRTGNIIFIIFWLSLFLYYKRRLLKISLVIFLYYILFIFFFNTLIFSRASEVNTSFNGTPLRTMYLSISQKFINEDPIKGIGAGSFVFKEIIDKEISLSLWEYQPVHNIFLLTASELGIPFFMFLFFLLIQLLALRNKTNLVYFKNRSLKLSIVLILFANVFDHYLYSFVSGMALFSFLIIFYITSYRLNQKLFYVEQFLNKRKKFFIQNKLEDIL